MIRQIIALFDEYQCNENAEHTQGDEGERAQGFWNGARADRLRIVEAASDAATHKKTRRSIPSRPKRAADPSGARGKRLIGSMGVKSIASI